MVTAGTIPGLTMALRRAATDVYQHSIRFVPLNLVFGFAAAALVWVALAGLPIPALIAAPLLALPAVAIARLAALVTRGADVVLSDAWVAIRELAVPSLVVGSVATLATVVLASNVVAGFGGAGVLSAGLAIASAWGLVALWLGALPVLVILADPARPGAGLTGALGGGALLLLAAPGRLVRLSIAVTCITVIGTILGAAILTVGLAYAVAVSARVVLPLADRWISAPLAVPVVEVGRADIR